METSGVRGGGGAGLAVGADLAFGADFPVVVDLSAEEDFEALADLAGFGAVADVVELVEEDLAAVEGLAVVAALRTKSAPRFPPAFLFLAAVESAGATCPGSDAGAVFKGREKERQIVILDTFLLGERYFMGRNRFIFERMN